MQMFDGEITVTSTEGTELLKKSVHFIGDWNKINTQPMESELDFLIANTASEWKEKCRNTGVNNVVIETNGKKFEISDFQVKTGGKHVELLCRNFEFTTV